MEKDFAKEIAARNEEITDSVEQMGKLRTAFVTGIQPFVAKWFQTITRQYIVRNPRKTIDLGVERLTSLKTKVGRLCGDVDRICTEVFSGNEYWPETRDLVTKNQLGIRIILGKLGTILEEFGLVKTQGQTENDHEQWSQYDLSGDRREFDGTAIYPHAIEIPDKMTAILEEYRVLVQRKDKCHEEIKIL